MTQGSYSPCGQRILSFPTMKGRMVVYAVRSCRWIHRKKKWNFRSIVLRVIGTGGRSASRIDCRTSASSPARAKPGWETLKSEFGDRCIQPWLRGLRCWMRLDSIPVQRHPALKTPVSDAECACLQSWMKCPRLWMHAYPACDAGVTSLGDKCTQPWMHPHPASIARTSRLGCGCFLTGCD